MLLNPININDLRKLKWKLIFKILVIQHYIISIFTHGKIVYLISDSNNCYISIAWPVNKSIDTSMLISYSFYLTKIGKIFLIPNGKVLNENFDTGYIINWLPVNKYKRMEMILQYDIKPFIM
jgi:hypothetical protein